MKSRNTKDILFGLVVLALIQNGLALPRSMIKADDKDYMLPTNVKPSLYEIELTIEENFAQTKTFKGVTSITLKSTEATSTIVMHASSLTIDKSDAYTIVEDKDVEKITLTLKEPLKANEDRVVKFTYTGKLHEDMYGFYLSSYKDEGSDVVEYIATTQFQGTYARRAFPCFDEPSFKAMFKLTINRPAGYTSMANTRQASSDANKDVYVPTPIMSTYLVAFIVSKFKGYGADRDPSRDEKYDVFCRENALDTAKYAYEIGPKILDELSKYTDIEYYDAGVNKMYQVAIPDFAAGAMENWGLVTYRETALLWDEKESTANYKQRVATVIAHEFAHMWFGDLVTLQWWSYTWLNEGFARYLQYFITKEVETTWELEKQFIVEQTQSIFVSDGVLSAFALSSDAASPGEVSNKFASISYSKGAAVINMMNSIMGVDNFTTGIRKYLDTHRNKNTEPKDLWNALSEHVPSDVLPAGLTFAQIMDAWTTQAGFPVINVKLEGNDAVLTQERFLYDNSLESDYKWNVPITYTTSHGPDFTSTDIKWLLQTEENLVIENVLHGQPGWIIVNLLENGYYRVNYDDQLWEQLEEALKADHTKIDVLNRAQIVDDLFNLARGNRVKYQRALDITSYLAKETDYYPWYAAFSGFSYIRKRRGQSDNLEKHIITMMGALSASVSFDIADDMNHVDILKTALALDWACTLGEESCVKKADELFEKFMESNEPINPNIRSTVYCSALRNEDGEDKWNFLWDLYTKTTLATEQNIILSALGCSKNDEIRKKYLLKSITEGEGIRKQDARTVFNAVLSGNLDGVNVGYEFFKDNLVKMSQYYGGMNDLSSIINNIADRFTTKEQIEDFERFTSEHEEDLKEAVNQIDSALQNAKANLNWAQNDLDQWLTDTYGSAASVTVSFSALIVVFVSIVYNLM